MPWLPRARGAALSGLAAVAVLASACGAAGQEGAPTSPGTSSAPSPSRPSSTASTASPSPPASGRQAPSDYSRLLLVDGDRVHLAGRVVSVPHRAVRLCAPVIEPAVGYAAGHEPVPHWCPLGVDVTAIELSALTRPRRKAGALEGWADVEAVYQAAGTVTVTAQHPYRPASGQGFVPDQPPCPAPPGGWPVGGQDVNLDPTALLSYSGAHPGSVIMRAALRPSRRQVLMYALTAGDPAPVEAALRPAYGPALCVVRSRYSQAQIASAVAAFRPDTPPARRAGLLVLGSGGLARDGQTVVDVSVVRVTREVAGPAARQPAGLVRLHPWLYPASVPAGLVPPP
jgi:hypothetical protein